MPKVLIVADVKNWAFDYFGKALQKYCKKISVDITYTRMKPAYTFDHKPYDIVFWMIDVRPDKLQKKSIPRKKVIYAIRSDIKTCPRKSYFKESRWIYEHAAAVAVCNRDMFDYFYKKHPKVYYMPGGVDIDIFKPQRTPYNSYEAMTVGWSGSLNYWGKELKGIEVIEEACNKAGLKFKPAILEQKRRNQKQMAEYYNTIHIYADMSSHAGRQNGILEAGACGKIVVATNIGIVSELIKHGENGFVSSRGGLYNTLSHIREDHLIFGEKLRKDVTEKWDWKIHAEKFEKMIKDVLK